MKLGILGASGLVGSALVEHLIDRQDVELVPLIHSSGNAWRLARLGHRLVQVDLLDKTHLERSLSGCTAIVNCVRGGNDVMLAGLRNLLEAARTMRIQRVIHLSSVLVYGDPPPPSAVNEDAPTQPERNSYGWTKLQQDNMVADAANRGLPCIVLCIPNVSGRRSYFLQQIVASIRMRRFALLRPGDAPCNLVDIDNLILAITLALERGTPNGRRLFVVDEQSPTWVELLQYLAPLAEYAEPIPEVSVEYLAQSLAQGTRGYPRLFQSLAHLFSSPVRQALRSDPRWARLERLLRSMVSRFGPEFEQRLRTSVDEPRPIQVSTAADARLCSQQLRRVRHSSQRAYDELEYRPQKSFSHSMEDFRSWYRCCHGMDTPFWELLQHL